MPVSIAYIPKGPLLNWADTALRTRVLRDLEQFTRGRGAFLAKLDPDVTVGTGIPESPEDLIDPDGQEIIQTLKQTGWVYSDNQIQFPNTVVIDLTASEDALMAGFKQKTRYNIRLADRRGVMIRTGEEKDLPGLYQLYAETALRDKFTIRDEGYYLRAWGDFLGTPGTNPTESSSPEAIPLIAEVEGEPIAAVIVYQFAGGSF